jgi:type II secretory pathway component PulM
VLLGDWLVIAPLRSGAARLEQALQAEQAGYRRAVETRRQILLLRGTAGTEAVADQVRAIASQQGIGRNAVSVRRPDASSLEVNLARLRWSQTVGLLQDLGQSQLAVQSLRLHREDAGSVTVTLRFSSAPRS